MYTPLSEMDSQIQGNLLSHYLELLTPVLVVSGIIAILITIWSALIHKNNKDKSWGLFWMKVSLGFISLGAVVCACVFGVALVVDEPVEDTSNVYLENIQVKYPQVVSLENIEVVNEVVILADVRLSNGWLYEDTSVSFKGSGEPIIVFNQN